MVRYVTNSFAAAVAALLQLCLALAAHAQQPGVVFVPTPHETVERMLRLARVGPGDFVIDLGSGDGRIPIAAARSGARALGIELDPELIRKSEADARAAGVASRVSFRREDLFKTPLDQATVITLYLLPEMNVRLRPRLLALRPGTRIVAHQFDIGDWKPDLVDDEGGRIFLWIVPASVGGRWLVRHGEQSFMLELQQRYQELSGAAMADGERRPLREATLRGSDIDFVIDVGGRATRFRGTVTGNTMQPREGSFGFEPVATGWSANRQ
jgi:SAM-dependent methyltransferase